MKKVLLSFLLLISIIINYELIFAMDYIPTNNEELKSSKEIVETLLWERSILWNQLFSEESDIEEIHTKLKSIVCEPLLSYDKNAFQEINNNHTNMDLIKRVKVKKIDILELEEKKMLIDAEVQWIMEDLSKEYEEDLNYRILLLKDEEWKISDYSLR